MRIFNFIKHTAAVVFVFAAIIGTANVAFAQGSRQERNEKKRIDKIEKTRVMSERKRQTEWTKQNNRIRMDQQRQTARNSRYKGTIYTAGMNNGNNRYRVYRNGSFYQTDNRGAELLRNAVNQGYRQGFAAGRSDRTRYQRVGWSNSSIYRSGSIGYDSHVNRGQYQYYFQQGFQRGYQDGSNVSYASDFDGQYEYGYYDNGSVNILDAILSNVLNIQTF